jgi:hypothetical protein
MNEPGLALLIISKHLRFIEPWRLYSPSHYANGHARVPRKKNGASPHRPSKLHFYLVSCIHFNFKLRSVSVIVRLSYLLKW